VYPELKLSCEGKLFIVQVTPSGEINFLLPLVVDGGDASATNPLSGKLVFFPKPKARML
jgi:hypothetical protein